MRKISLLLVVVLLLTACSSLEDIASNTKKANDHLSGIDANSSIPKFIKDSIDVFVSRAKYDDIYSANVIWDTSYALSENWFRFFVHTRPKPDVPEVIKYAGFVNTAMPSLLYISEIKRDNVPMKPPAEVEVNIEADAKGLTDRRLLNVNETDWQKILVAGRAVFDGFELKGRNLNYLDLSRYSFNYTLLNADTLYKVNALSPDKLETGSNSFRYMYLSRSIMSGANFKNWHFVTDDLNATDYWFANKIYSTEFNDVVMRKIGINACTFDNCIFRNTNYGSFKNIRFNRDTLQNCWVENAFFEESEFLGCFLSGNILTSRFLSTKFGNSLGGPVTNTVFSNMPRIQGKFTNCLFNTGVKFTKSNILESEFTGGNFTEVNFLQDCYIKNTFFKNVTFRNVNFDNTKLGDVQFGDPTAAAGVKMLMASCDFRKVKWDPNVTFHNVNLIGSTFPARSVLNSLGVQFIGCENEPLQ